MGNPGSEPWTNGLEVRQREVDFWRGFEGRAAMQRNAIKTLPRRAARWRPSKAQRACQFKTWQARAAQCKTVPTPCQTMSYGGGGGSRTRVPEPISRSLYAHSQSFGFSPARLRLTGFSPASPYLSRFAGFLPALPGSAAESKPAVRSSQAGPQARPTWTWPLFKRPLRMPVRRHVWFRQVFYEAT